MTSRFQAQVIIGIAVLVWALMLLTQGVTLKASYLQPYSLAVGVVILLLFAFDHWLWRIPLLARVLHCPLLRGTWRGQLRSTWKDSTTSQAIEPIDVFLVVRQTYSTISQRLMTKESSSRSLVASLEVSRDEVPTLSSMYQNMPDLLKQGRSRIHHGALMLEVQGNPANRLKGYYWTDRDTKGEVSLDARSKKVYTSFDEAAAAIWPSS
jgi:hypothetical protein